MGIGTGTVKLPSIETSPKWLTKNFLNNIRRFNTFVGSQSMEPTILFRRKFKGPTVTKTLGVDTGAWFFRPITSLAGQWMTVIFQGTETPPQKPFLRTMLVFVGNQEMKQIHRDKIRHNDEYFIELDAGGPKTPVLFPKINLGFNTGFDPRTLGIKITYEEVCNCTDVSEISLNPASECGSCFGTAYVGGFDRFRRDAIYHGRKLIVPQDHILVRFPLNIRKIVWKDMGLEIEDPNTCWTFSDPILSDWDLLVRRVGDDKGDFLSITDHSLSQTRVFNADAVGSNLLSQRFRTTILQEESIIRNLPLS